MSTGTVFSVTKDALAQEFDELFWEHYYTTKRSFCYGSSKNDSLASFQALRIQATETISDNCRNEARTYNPPSFCEG